MWRTRVLSADVRETVVNQSRDEFVDDAVVGFAPFFTGRDQLEMTKKRELVTHRRHGQPERVCQITDAKLLVRERVHQPQAKRIGQCEKNFHCFGRGFVGG